MDHPCEKCGAVIEDGIAFCSQCGAPQIRVRGFSPPPDNPLPSPEFADLLTGRPPEDTVSISPTSQRLVESKLRWTDAWRGAVLAGFFLTVAMAVPNAMPLAWFFIATVAAGALAATLYARRSRLALTLAQGARLGMLGGLAGWVAWVTISVLMIVLGGAQLVNSLREAVQKVVATSDPRAREILTTPGMMAVFIVLSMLFLLVLVLLCSAMGGMIGAKLFGKSTEQKR